MRKTLILAAILSSTFGEMALAAPDVVPPRQDDLAELEFQFPKAMARLGAEGIGEETHLGTSHPRITAAAVDVVSLGPAVVPDLKKALSSRRPVLVGHAALCLVKLNRFDAEPQAKEALEYFQGRNDSLRNQFAIHALEWYIRLYR